MKEIRKMLLMACAACAALPAAAEEDFALTYRGRITAQQNMPEELKVTYSLYVGEDDTNSVWSLTKTEHPAANGAFQSVLSGNDLQLAFENRKARFLGIQLGTNRVEQYPRQEILAVPLAEYADTVDGLPDSPEFSQASVGTLEAETLTAASLTVTNLLSVPGDSLRLENVALGDGAKLSVRKPANGSVRLFAGEPRTTEIPRSDGQTSGDVTPEYLWPGSVIFPVITGKGGLVMAMTTATSWWNQDYAAPCITWAIGPGETPSAPVQILLPAKFWFYEFGN